mgnify:CR=1 FL=1
MTTGVAQQAGPPASAPAAVTDLIKRFAPAVIGVAATLALWQVGGILVAMNPDTASFADFAPVLWVGTLG